MVGAYHSILKDRVALTVMLTYHSSLKLGTLILSMENHELQPKPLKFTIVCDRHLEYRDAQHYSNPEHSAEEMLAI